MEKYFSDELIREVYIYGTSVLEEVEQIPSCVYSFVIFNFIVKYFGGICSLIYALFIMIPATTIVIRRLHDIDHLGIGYFLWGLLGYVLVVGQMWIFLPAVIVGWIWIFVLLVKKGRDRPNWYGKPEW